MRHLILFVFFLSGLSALGLETLWTRLFSLVFGGTALATVTVLTAYMAGLAWGSGWGGRRADALTRPLVTYAWLEAGIGIWGMLMPVWIACIAPLHQWSSAVLPPTAVALLRFFLATLLMLVPTAMMGATLPVLSRYFARSEGQISFDVGLLYTINTAGAVAGCMLTGFLFLPQLGIQSTILVLAGVNLVLAGVMGWYGRHTIMAPHPEVTTATTRPPLHQQAENQDTGPENLYAAEELAQAASTDEVDSTEWLAWQRFRPTEGQMVLLSFAVSGGLAMLCQVCWNRVLTLVIGSSIYAFTLILSTFLLGLTAGSSVGSWWSRRMQDPALWLVAVLTATAGLVWGSVVLVDQLPLSFLRLARQVQLTPALLFAIKALLAAMLVFFPTFAMGLMFPLVIRGYFHDNQAVGRTVGQVYACNTTGAIVGSFASGFLLIPWLGLQGTLLAVVVVYLLLALGLLWFRQETAPLWFRLSILPGMGVLLLVTIFATPVWNRSHLSLGLYRIAQLQRLDPSRLLPRKLLNYQEGLHATVVLEQYDQHVIALKINGKPDASSGIDMPTQMLAALLPLSFHGQAKEVLVIGWGSGVTAGTALQFPLKRLTAVEIEPAVVSVAQAFHPWNYQPQQDPRLRLVYDDARNLLHSHPQRFDVIISEPSNPWISGVSALFTREFFRLAQRRLSDRGMLCQWIQLYELSPQNIRVLLNTVASVFPYVYLFGISHRSHDTLLLATRTPLRKDLHNLQTWFQQPRLRQAFLRAGLSSPIDWLPRLLADNQSIRALVRDAPLNTDDNAWIELRAPLDLLTHATSDGSAYLRTALGAQYNRHERVFVTPKQTSVRPKGCTPATAFAAQLLLARLRFGDIQRGASDAAKLCRTPAPTPDYIFAQRLYRSLLHGEPGLEQCLRRAGQTTQYLRVIACWNQHSQTPLTRQQLQRWAQQPKNSAPYRTVFGLLRYARGETWESLQLLAPLVQKPAWLQRHPLLYYLLGQLYRQRNIWPEAVWFTGHYLSTSRSTLPP